MNKRILLVASVREKSMRCKNKMTRSFGNTTLFDIMAKKMERLKDLAIFDEVIVSMGREDSTLWKMKDNYSVKIQERDVYSITNADTVAKVHPYFKDYSQSHIMWLNSSFPFITIDTICKCANFFINNDINSLHLVKKKANWYWSKEMKPLNIRDKSLICTQDSEPIYESVHAFHIYNRKYAMDNNAYWDFSKDNPFLYVVDDSFEFLDIDTENDFKLCEMVRGFI